MSPHCVECADVIPLIKRGDLAHYRHLARHAAPDTLRVLVLVMADDLEEALDAACPLNEQPAAVDLPGS